MGSQNSTRRTKIKTTRNKLKTNALKHKRDRADIYVQIDYFERKLDDKRRLTIPAELREEFASGVVITQGFGNYLHMYPKSVWDQLVEPELQGSILDERVADLNVKFRMGKVENELDQKQGRVAIEQHLLDYGDISKDVYAVRAGKYWRLLGKKN